MRVLTYAWLQNPVSSYSLERHGVFLLLVVRGTTIIVSQRLSIPIYLASRDDGDDFLFDKPDAQCR